MDVKPQGEEEGRPPTLDESRRGGLTFGALLVKNEKDDKYAQPLWIGCLSRLYRMGMGGTGALPAGD